MLILKVMESDQKQYELVCILSPFLEGDTLEEAKREIEKIVSSKKGKIVFKESEKKELAYPINKQGQGIFTISQISVLPENVPVISKELKLNKRIIRHLINQMPSIVKEVDKKLKNKKPKRTSDLKTEQKQEISKKTAKEEQQEGKTKLEEIDKKLDEIIKDI